MKLAVASLVGALTLTAIPARAELVFFATGRTMSVKGHRAEGDSLVLTLRSGGEIVCEASTIAHIAPDEVPYPEPVPEPPAPVVVPIPADATAMPYGEIIDKVAAQQGVNAKLVRALVQVESAYQPRARSLRRSRATCGPSSACRRASRVPASPAFEPSIFSRIPTERLALFPFRWATCSS